MQINMRFCDKRILKYLYEEETWIQDIYHLRNIFNYNKSVNILMFDTINELSRFIGRKVPSWVIATHTQDSVIMINYNLWKDREVGTFGQILVHELAHVIIYQVAKSPCPIWLNEGLAMHFAKQIENIHEIESICDFDDIYDIDFRNKDVYHISACMTKLIISKYGIDNVISRLKVICEFYDDNIFGRDNVSKLLSESRNSTI